VASFSQAIAGYLPGVAETKLSSFSGYTSAITNDSPAGTARGTITQSFSTASSQGITRTASSGTTFYTEDRVTTTSSSSSSASYQSTTIYPWGTYRSNTQTTTQATAVETTTSANTTTTRTISTTGPNTTTTTATDTALISTTSGGTATITTYATAATTTLAGPIILVGVSEAAGSEQAWEISAGANTADYVSALGSTFTKRSANPATTSTALPVVSSATFTVTQELEVNVSGGLTGSSVTLTTTATVTTADTYVPFASVYPATSTATRAFTMLTTSTTLWVRAFTSTVTYTLTANSTAYTYFPGTVRRTTTATVSITINANPTSTITAAFHLSYATSRVISSLTLFNFLSTLQATSSSSANASGGTGLDTYTSAATAATTRGTSTTATSAVVTTLTSSNTAFNFASTASASGTASSTESSTFVTTGTSFDFGLGAPASDFNALSTYRTLLSTTSSSGETDIFGSVESTYQTSFSSAILTDSSSSGSTHLVAGFPGASSTYSFQTNITTSSNGSSTDSGTFTTDSWTYTYTNTISTATTATTSTNTTTTVIATATGTSANAAGGSSSAVQGISYTGPALAGQATFDASAQASEHAMRQAGGFRDPLALATTAALFSAMSLAPANTIYLPSVGVQDNQSGDVAALLGTLGSYANGSSVYTAEWLTSDSRLHFTTGLSSTFTTTAGTATVTRIVTTSTSTGTASFSGTGSQTYFSASSTSGGLSGSAMGGQPAKSEFAARVILPPGVVHSTGQTGGTTSASFTTWLNAASVVTATAVGVALPTRSETAFSITQSTAGTLRPAVTLSKYPNL
jgi:hypothetical protein